MTAVSEAFDTFRGRLQTTATENQTASRRQRKIREQLDASDLDIDTDFLTGSYRRETKTKPLRDVDIMVVLADRSFLGQHPTAVLNAIRDVLAPHYGEHRVTLDRRAVRIDFGLVTVDDVTDGDVMSFDVVPAVTDGDNYLIPDDVLGTWIATNPKRHEDLATTANKGYDQRWKPLVKMIKKWNFDAGDPIIPSFLLEVLALDLISGGWAGPYPYELRMFFASAADRLADRWPDPAHAGPDISDILDADPAAMGKARQALRDAERACTRALALERSGNNTAAIREWRNLFGPLFPAP
jgi:hypothetical protein